MKTIETNRTILRWFKPDDVEGALSFLGNSEVMRFSLSGPYDRKKCQEFVDWCLGRYELKGYGLFAVTLKETKKIIGYCGFYDQKIDGCDEVELGYRLHPEFWNKGLGTEVALSIQNYGFHELGFPRLISIIESENKASIRVAKKNGMNHEKDSMFKDQVPVEIYSIKKEEHIKSVLTTPRGAPPSA
ncbi:GNAT family N-acetyltransferase [Pelagicoccus sp. NFK12]|uniref:GNAT family N-acetyltransferase n=1 Tax=Pelagicoccus enzymogenes TaxID=2773457 RepID=A0A927IGB9_9BACT|nr:GNAT family N-acetyltransferase [Pelagicoccus enzymogenes]MBD5778230.1 GNAT family N-acetyltransferase [Pelagicoccus enzymogenes]